MNIKKGDIYGFIGRNGAGKTTTLKMIVGLTEPTSGEITLFGSNSLSKGRRKTGTVIESPVFVPHFSARKNMYIQWRLLNSENENIIDETLELVGLKDVGNKKAKDFSLGMKQRLGIGMALMGNPEFLVLDEPTNDLDIMTLQVLEQYLQDFRGCVIVVSHDRYFMDKVVDHLLVFKGDGVIDDFPGNYTQYRNSKAQVSMQSDGATSNVVKPRLSEQKKRLSYKEQKELESLELAIGALEKEKKEIEERLSGTDITMEEIMRLSVRLPQLEAEMEEKTMRWMELEEKKDS